MKKIIAFLFAGAMILSLCSCSSSSEAVDSKTSESSTSAAEEEYDYTPETTEYNVKDDVDDWMKDQAKGKSYGSDDGGTYYCMGKGDTCPNKTHNAYDLYCSSCDPDGDNIEG